VLATKHYQIDVMNAIRVEQTIQGMVGRPTIFCSPECSSQYVQAWLASRVKLDAGSVEAVASPAGVDAKLP
jgi:hypothetical protein